MIHNIVNQQIANLANCESEPIHTPGSIQPFGALLAVKPGSFIIEYCSANIGTYLGFEPVQLLGNHLHLLFSKEGVERLQPFLYFGNGSSDYPFTIRLNEQDFNVHVSTKNGLILLEFEPRPGEEITQHALYGQMKRFAAGAEEAQSMQQLCQTVADETRAITGFDRVMIYQFDAAYNGQVVAESKGENIESYLNLYYPHTDIPPQARQLYLTNLVRLIADVDYTPVPLVTLNRLADYKAVDLSNAVLRSVSPIHIEYLKNMGVQASFSVSLVHEGRLWGLIACHHYAAIVLPHHTRLAAQLQGHFLTSQVKVQQAKDAYERSQLAEVHLQYLQKQLINTDDFIAETYENRHLLQLVNATGVLVVSDGKLYKNGVLPDDAALLDLVNWLANHTSTGHLHTDSLVATYPRAKDLGDVAAGLLYHSLGASELNCVIWFRPEVAQTIDWAGNPEKAILEKANGVRISPRKSFDVWRQEVRNKSEAWSVAELAAAASFAYALQKQIHLTAISREEIRYRKLSEQLIEANEELSRINWISTHDLKEPLRKIQIFGSRILESEKETLSEMVANSVSRMRVAASRMQTLVDDILLYSKMNVRDDGAALPVVLDEVLKDVIAEIQEDFDAIHATIQVAELPVVSGIYVQLRQLFSNLLSNALKFARKDLSLNIQITCDQVPLNALKEAVDPAITGYYKVSIQDNGIGFEPEYANRIFDVFQRLHTAADYAGTGIGLAICRKIMLNHDGTISAEGELGNGAVFHLYFPIKD